MFLKGKMKVLIISGFLGAGKTTFIRELIRRTEKQIAVLENEFGDTDLDSRSLSGGSVNVMEISEGCVCCTRREGFFNSVITIAAAIDPEYLVVEPSGVARLSSILSNLQKAQYENISLLPPVVLLPPASYREHMALYPEIYADQIENAGHILFTKAEQEDSALLSSVAAELRKRSPNAEIVTGHYSTREEEWWLSLLRDEREAPPTVSGGEESPELETAALSDVSLHNPGELVVLLEDILRREYGDIVRAKGVVAIRGEYVRFDVADNRYAILGDADYNGDTQCVFIGRELDRTKLSAAFLQTIRPIGGGKRLHFGASPERS